MGPDIAGAVPASAPRHPARSRRGEEADRAPSGSLRLPTCRCARVPQARTPALPRPRPTPSPSTAKVRWSNAAPLRRSGSPPVGGSMPGRISVYCTRSVSPGQPRSAAVLGRSNGRTHGGFGNRSASHCAPPCCARGRAHSGRIPPGARPCRRPAAAARLAGRPEPFQWCRSWSACRGWYSAPSRAPFAPAPPGDCRAFVVTGEKGPRLTRPRRFEYILRRGFTRFNPLRTVFPPRMMT